MTCKDLCKEHSGVRVTLWCKRSDQHPPHDWFSRKSGRIVHCCG